MVHEPLERRDYLSLLLELGYNESAIEALEAQADSLFTKATGFVQIDDFESAMPLLEDALKLAPWRCDILKRLSGRDLRIRQGLFCYLACDRPEARCSLGRFNAGTGGAVSNDKTPNSSYSKARGSQTENYS